MSRNNGELERKSYDIDIPESSVDISFFLFFLFSLSSSFPLSSRNSRSRSFSSFILPAAAVRCLSPQPEVAVSEEAVESAGDAVEGFAVGRTIGRRPCPAAALDR